MSGSRIEPIVGEVYRRRGGSAGGVGEGVAGAAPPEFWRAEVLVDGAVRMVQLDARGEATETFELVGLEEFGRRFAWAPDFAVGPKSPKNRMLERIVALADEHFRRKEYFSAEYEYKNALELDENHVWANFGLGETYLAQNEDEKAREVFLKLSRIEAVYHERHKHLFNELGIRLRKLGLYRESLEHYLRALTIARDDEHLWFNAARALDEDDQPELAARLLKKALELNPDFWQAKQVAKRGFGQIKSELRKARELPPRLRIVRRQGREASVSISE